jgi:hypothetical protein
MAKLDHSAELSHIPALLSRLCNEPAPQEQAIRFRAIEFEFNLAEHQITMRPFPAERRIILRVLWSGFFTLEEFDLIKIK